MVYVLFLVELVLIRQLLVFVQRNLSRAIREFEALELT